MTEKIHKVSSLYLLYLYLHYILIYSLIFYILFKKVRWATRTFFCYMFSACFVFVGKATVAAWQFGATSFCCYF